MCNINRCRCLDCERYLPSTDIAVSGSNLNVTVDSINVVNGQENCVFLAQSFAAPATPSPVILTIGTTAFQMVTKCGNSLYSDQIKQYDTISVRLTTDTRLAVVQDNCLRCTSVSLPVLPAAAAAVASKK